MKVPQGDDEWSSKQRKDTKGENPKNIYVYEIHYSKYQLVKSMYKIITSLFLRNHLKLIAIRDTVKLNVFKKSA